MKETYNDTEMFAYSVLVRGPYVVRSAEIGGSTLALVGTASATGSSAAHASETI